MPFNNTGRRSTYFAFQGLFMAVLLLLVLYDALGRPDTRSLWVLVTLLGTSLVVLRMATEETLTSWWFQAGLFVGDGLAATATLQWSHSKADLFLLNVLLIFGSALTRSNKQRITIASLAIGLHLISGWYSSGGMPTQSEFWLRAIFLTISAILMMVLARDVRQVESEHKKRYEDRLVQVGRLATLGRVAGEVAHRIKGPLTTISVDAEVLAHRLKDDKHALKELREITSEVEKCKGILKDLLDLGRIEEMDVEGIDLRTPVKQAIKSMQSRVKSKRIQIVTSGFDKPMRIRGDASLIQEAISSILQNAVESIESDGEITVIGINSISKKGFHQISIVDDGAGISQADLEKIFEPFFTTKKEEGSGLGLSAALRIAAKHNGTIEAASPGLGRGARFTFVVPAA